MPFSDQDKRFMRMAIAKAGAGIRRGQTPFGACIVLDGKVVSCEHNVVWRTTDITAHAEIHAIRRANAKLGRIDLAGCVIYSTCEPCPMCFSACHWAKFDRVVFGSGIRDAVRAGFHELTIPARTMKRAGGSPVVVAGGCLREETDRLFAQWGRMKDRQAY